MPVWFEITALALLALLVLALLVCAGCLTRVATALESRRGGGEYGPEETARLIKALNAQTKRRGERPLEPGESLRILTNKLQ